MEEVLSLLLPPLSAARARAAWSAGDAQDSDPEYQLARATSCFDGSKWSRLRESAHSPGFGAIADCQGTWVDACWRVEETGTARE